MISKWTSSIQDVFHRRGRKRGGIARRRPELRERRLERLEDRRVMAFDLVSAYATSDAPFFVAGGTAQTLTEAPQQMTLRFSPGVKIDPATLGSISIVRSGGAGDPFGNANDKTLLAGTNYLALVNDVPNQNEIIVRFADTLPDDSYRITVAGGSSGLKTLPGDTLAATRTFDVRLDLGAFVRSVVPQPVSRSAGGALAQNRNQIIVYFNDNDPLNTAAATRPTSYRLFEIDTATGEATKTVPDGIPIFVNPTSVTYESATGKATLTFASNAIADGKIYRLQVGAAEDLKKVADPVAEGANTNSSFATARDLGVLSSSGATVNGAIDPSSTVPTPLSGVAGPGGTATDLLYPSQPGSVDEPGHRDLPPEIGNNHGDSVQSLAPGSAIVVQQYNFQDNYGRDPQGNQLKNGITETQKQRAREVFELFSRYTGIRFVETPNSGITVVTGDIRAANPLTPPDAVAGIGGSGLAIMSGLVNWGASEYGGSWFQVAVHEIGHALGLDHSYDIPSIMGAGLSGEPVFPGDYDTIHLAQLYPANGSDVDVYKFTLSQAGRISAETVVARPGQIATSKLDSLLTLYREETVGGKTTRSIVSRNDDYYGRDSFVGLDLQPGTYYVAVSSTGNDRFDPEVNDSGYGGRSDGAYQLKLGFQPQSLATTTVIDASGTQLDGDRDGKAGGAFNFWFKTASSTNNPTTNGTIFVDKASAAAGDGSGTLASPFKRIDLAIAAAAPGSIVRIVGNTANSPYRIGTDLAGRPLPDGDTFNVPAGVTVMIDEGAVFKFRAAILDVGSSSALGSRAGASLQVLGTPSNSVTFTSYHDDSIGGDSDNVGPAVKGGQWGGIVLRTDSDFATPGGLKTAFVNSISHATITYGGGQVVVDSQLESFAPIQLENTRPTLAFNTISSSAGAAISATPNSFEDSNGRVGPEIRGNRLTSNSINGLFVKVRTPFGGEPERLDVSARLRSTDIVYVLQDNLFIAGGAGGYIQTGANDSARRSGRLAIDPGVIVKLQGSRIELERGTSQLIAEGTARQGVIFTSLGDNRFGAGGTFDTNGNLPDKFDAQGRPIGTLTTGDWGGIVLDAGSKASIDYAYLAYGGGQAPIEGSVDRFNVIETHQGDLRLAHSRLENNADGAASTNRVGRGSNVAATVFVRGAQPVILSNDFRNNLGAVISVNANAFTESENPDPGRSLGSIERLSDYDDNRGPLIRNNTMIAGSRVIISATTIPASVTVGSTIGSLTATGMPSTGISFELVGGIGATDNALFLLVGNRLTLAATPTKNLLEIRVRATSTDGLSIETALTLTVEGTVTYGYTNVDTPDADKYLVSSTGMKKYRESFNVGNNYWGPTNSGTTGELLYRYDFPGTPSRIKLKAATPTWDFNNEPGGSGRGASAVEVSKDGRTWITLHNNIEPLRFTVVSQSWSIDGDLPAEVLGGTSLWLRVKLYAEGATGGYTTAQFSRSTPNATDPVFQLQAFFATSAPAASAGSIMGMQVRGEEITVESVWDDTDIAHVLQNEIIVNNFHTATGLRLVSKADASLVVKLGGGNAGFTAAGYGLDIADRIGGTVQVVGQPGYPVILTSIKDDTVGASLDPLGQLIKDTNADGGASSPVAGDWRSLRFLPASNDRNVSVVEEAERAAAGWLESNSLPARAQVLGVLAPNLAVGVNTRESAQEKSGDDNRRLGFEVRGAISFTNPGDVDVYSFTGYAGSEVWIDVDKTSPGLDAMVELLNAAGSVVARSADTQTDLALSAGTRGIGQDLERDAWRGGDFYSVNPKDPGMRVILPGTSGALNQYYIRVRSQPKYDAATPAATYEADLVSAAKVAAGATRGAYELRVRLQQRDDKPGSTVRYADIRFPQIGIDVQGLPRNSLLTGETGESAADNGTFGNAQYVGNVLQSDKGTISIAGDISSVVDVDWYTFALNYEQLQSITGVNAATKSWSTIFDIDYGDGFRGDLTISVFDSTGKLIYVGRDSDVASDQPGAGQGIDADDLSRGSAGKLDPFIGSVQLPAGGPTGSGGVESGGAVVPPDTSKQLRYYVAVSSNEQLPAVLDATLKSTATNSLVRLEPVNSVDRIVEDHIGFNGYQSGTKTAPQQIDPVSRPIIDIANLSAHVTPFTLADVTLFVSTPNRLLTVDPQRGYLETEIQKDYGPNQDIGDLVMRSDGRLYAYAGLGVNVDDTAGRLELVDTGTGVRTPIGNDSIPNAPTNTTVTETNVGATNVGFVSTTTFDLANKDPIPATVRGTVSYTAAIGGLPTTGLWNFTSSAGGGLTFTAINAPAGMPAPIDMNSVVDPVNGRVSIVWSGPVSASKTNPVLATVRYSYTASPQAVTTDQVDAIAWQRTDVAKYDNLFYSVRDGSTSRLYKANPTTGSAAAPTPNPNGYGRVGAFIQDVNGSLGVVTGMAFVGTALYGVDNRGYLFQINPATGVATLIDIDPLSAGSNLAGVQFAGLSIGPQNLANGAFANTLFAISRNGTLYAFDTAGNRLAVFDQNNDGIAGDTSVSTGIGSVTGLAFSPLDFNLWHPTVRRGGDPGHGVNPAPDNSRTGERDLIYGGYNGALVYDSEVAGGQSMYFGLHKYQAEPFTEYFVDARGGQYGSGQQWHEDISTNPAFLNNYNLPGGAHGILTTNSFSLATYDYTDKPTLYFNYWLATQGAQGGGRYDDMRDSARVHVSTDGGLTWELVATNNSARSLPDASDSELPAFPSVSSRISTAANQHVQELFDTSSWRQARIDLGRYAGQANLRLRFDFSTAGEFDSNQKRAVATTVASVVANRPDVVVADVSGILPGMDVVAAGVLNVKVVSIDSATSTVTLSGNVTLALGDAIAFSQRINDIQGPARISGDFSSPERGQNNAHEGFFIDDIIVGLAERGEMVTGANAGQTAFSAVGTPLGGSPTVPAQALSGPYQLEIRHGTTYAAQPDENKSDVTLFQIFDSDFDLTERTTVSDVFGNPVSALGDANTPRQQGQFLIQNNIISSAATYGISIDAGVRDALAKTPLPGTTRSLPVLNNSRLVPGVVVANNVVSSSGTAGVLFSGDPNTGSVPTAAVPYGRIINNTIYGGGNPAGTGVLVTENAGPTLMNNVFASLATGVNVDASSQVDAAGNPRTVISASAFHAVASPVDGGATQSNALLLASSPFVKASAGNFYPIAGSPVIDSAINSIADRAEYVVVNVPLGVPQSPIIAPDRDLFGQLRGDDPLQASDPGLGSNVFKDRGAIDRVDFMQPYAQIAKPLDGNADDLDPAADSVLIRAAGRPQTAFELQLNDIGVGIDRSTVMSAAFTLSCNGAPLVLGVDYVFRYLETTNRVVFESASVFPLGTYVIGVAQQTVGGVTRNAIADLAGNALLGNKSDGTLSFSIALADVPAAPGKPVGTPGNTQVVLTWPAPVSDGNSPITDFAVQVSTDGGVTWAPFADGVSATNGATVTGLVNGTSYVFRVRATNVLGDSGWSPISDPVKAGIVPGVPTALAAGGTGAVSGQVILTWTAPGVLGDPVLSDYVVESSTDAGATWTVFNDGVKSTTGATLTGLTDGVSYLFRVKSRNTVGDSSYTATVSAVPGILPGAPTALAGTPTTPGGVNLSWTAPGTLGSPALTDYVVQYKVSGQPDTAYVTFADGVSSTTGANVTGLTAGTQYVFRVKAVNLVGDSPWSTASGVVSPGVVPGVPTALAAGGTGAVSGQVVLTWTAPVVVGNPVLSDYVVESSTDAGATWTVFNDGVKSTTGATLTGLTDGVSYLFRVKSRNTVGDSGYTATVSAVPGILPGAPTSLAGVPSTVGGVALTWMAPGTVGSPALTDYVVEYKVFGQPDTAYVTFNDGVQSTTGATVTGLTSGTQYVFRVKARNVVGDSPWATISGTASPGLVPGVPTALAAGGTGAVSGQVVLTWTAPVVVGNPVLSDYVVESSTDAGATWTVFNDGVKSTTGATVTGLTDGVSYLFRVKSRNTVGDSSYTATVSAMPGVLPGAPAGLNGLPDAAARSVALTWAAPATRGSPALTDYVVQYKVNGRPDSEYVTFNDGQGTTTGATVTGLANATTYVFRVTAVNALGTGLAATTKKTVPATAPSAPQNLVVASVASGSATLTWAAPADNGGATISDYIVQFKLTSQPDSAYRTFADGVRSTTGATVTGLVNGSSYTFRVAAQNSAGVGGYVVSAPATPWPIAPAPTRLTGTAGNGSVSLVWTAPTVAAGTSILDYVVQARSYTGGIAGPWTTITDTVSSSPRAVVSVPNGVAHDFRVAAITTGNVIGQYSLASPMFTPFQAGAVPAAPTNVVATPIGRGALSLTWTAPPATGGGAVSGYVVQYALAGTNTWATLNVTGPTATISRLISGRNYNFRVAARNLAGVGAYTAPILAQA